MGRVVPKRAYILLGRQRLRFADRLYFLLNGVIWVDRKDKVNREASKADMISYLNEGRSIIMFPEGTWNLTENMLLLPMKWGIVQIAQETGAQIIPTILEYDRDRKQCHISFGEPMLFLPSDEKAKAIAALRDTMATMIWNTWECRGLFSREALDIEAEVKKLEFSIEEYPTIDWEYEESCIYHPHIEPSEAFAHLGTLLPSKENAFLFDKRLIGYPAPPRRNLPST